MERIIILNYFSGHGLPIDPATGMRADGVQCRRSGVSCPENGEAPFPGSVGGVTYPGQGPPSDPHRCHWACDAGGQGFYGAPYLNFRTHFYAPLAFDGRNYGGRSPDG